MPLILLFAVYVHVINLNQPAFPEMLQVVRVSKSELFWKLLKQDFLQAGRPSCHSMNSIKTVKEQVRKVLWTRKAPSCLLTLIYAYGKPHVCINIHQYASLLIVLQQAAAVDAALHPLHRQYTSEGSTSSFKLIM